MNSSLYNKQQLKYLASILRTNVPKLQFTVNNAESQYCEWEEVKIDKRTGEVKMKNGQPATRRLRMATGSLAEIQGKIKKYILSSLDFPDCVHGCIKGRSNITNGKAHQGKKYKFTTDLRSFYDTINAEKVFYAFCRLKFSEPVAHWLTGLTTLNNAVPQGAATSNHLQNLIFRPTDNFLMMVCKKLDLTYTRYVDDLTFSSSQCFKEHIPELLSVIINSGYKINNRKTNYSRHALITGIEAKNNFIDISEELKEAARLEQNAGKSGPYLQYLKLVRSTNFKLPIETRLKEIK
jgi:RNA-directed DNA polymerase